MPSDKDNIKSFDTAKRKESAVSSKGNAKKPQSKSGSNVKQITEFKKAESANKKKNKTQNLKEHGGSGLSRKEERAQKAKEAKDLKALKKQNRADKRAERRAAYAEAVPDKVANEVIGIILIGLGIFMYMCQLEVFSTGVVGDMIDQSLHGFFGYFSYALPAVIIFGGIMCIVSANKAVNKLRLVFGIAAVVLIMSWLQIFPYENGKFSDETYVGFLKSTYNKGLESVGTGLLTASVTYGAVQLFGMAGAKLLLMLMFIASMLIVTNQSIVKITKNLSERLKENKRISREKEREFVRSEMKTVNPQPKPPIKTTQPRYRQEAMPEDDFIEPRAFKDNLNNKTAERVVEEEHESRSIPKKQKEAKIISLNRRAGEQAPENDDVAENAEYADDGSRPTIIEMPEFTGEKRKMNVTVDGEIIDDGSVESIAAPVGKPKRKAEPYIFPSSNLLEKPKMNQISPVDEEEVYAKARAIEQTLSDFGIGGKVNNITHGPVITRYEYSVPSGTKMSKVTSLDRELAYSLECSSIRIEAPIPNKAAIGIEVPNKQRSTVYMRELLESKEFQQKDSLLAFVVGKDIAGNIIIGDIAKMPHTLISGATGSGKSVFINSILLSILYKASPYDVKLIMVDPKKVEFEKYKGIPHLMFPVVSNPKRAAGVLAWCVKEMEDRYEKMAKVGVRDLRRYNQLMKNDPSDDPDLQPLPLIVIVIDELSDLMVVAGDEVEDSIYRLAQMARAAGMYLIIATQRPSVDVVTGVIKANIPSRIALKVASPHDSRTIIDSIAQNSFWATATLFTSRKALTEAYVFRVRGFRMTR